MTSNALSLSRGSHEHRVCNELSQMENYLTAWQWQAAPTSQVLMVPPRPLLRAVVPDSPAQSPPPCPTLSRLWGGSDLVDLRAQHGLCHGTLTMTAWFLWASRVIRGASTGGLIVLLCDLGGVHEVGRAKILLFSNKPYS